MMGSVLHGNQDISALLLNVQLFLSFLSATSSHDQRCYVCVLFVCVLLLNDTVATFIFKLL